MAHSFDNNTVPATGALCIYKMLALWLLQTWTKPKDSDGITYSATGVQITHGGTSTNGLGNNYAWFIITYPGGVRSFCFQRGTTNTVWRIKYSKSAGFTSAPIGGGAIDATHTPSAADEKIINGGGTDFAPTFATLLAADGTHRFNCCAGDATVGYGWYFHTFQPGQLSVTVAQYGMMMDVMTTGSFPAEDTDPIVIYNVAGNAYAFGTDFYSSSKVQGWIKTTFQIIYPLVYTSPTLGANAFPATTVSNGVQLNPYTLKDDIMPVPYARLATSGSPSGWKGFGQFIQWLGTYKVPYTPISTTGVNSRDKIYLNGTLLPWDGSLPLF